MKKISGVFLTILMFFSSTLNVFADTIEVFEEKTEKINKEDYEKYKEDLEKKVLTLNETDDDYVYDYEVSVKEEEDEVIITEKETITSRKKFETEDAAKKYYNEFELESAWKKGELKITTNDESVTVSGDEITITCETANCETEIALIEASLNEYQKMEVIKKETTSKEETTEIIYSIEDKEQELTAEEAASIILTLKPELEGYTFIKNEAFLTRTGSVEQKTYQDIYGNVKFETQEEAETALLEFLNREDYTDITGIIVSMEDEEDTKIEKYTSKGFLTKELAIQAAKKEVELSSGNIIIIASEPYQKKSYDIKEITKKEFNNKEEAALYLAEELKKGYVASDIKYEQGELVITGKVLNEIKAARSQNKYIIKNSEYALIDEEDKNNIVVWTRNEWTNEQKTQFINSTIKNHKDITNKTKFTFISGYKTFDMSKLGKKWSDAYTFTKDTLKIGKTGDTAKVYIGTIESYNKVLLNCTLTKTISTWYVDYEKTTKDFDYVIVGGATKVIPDMFKIKSVLSKTIYTHNLTYKVNTTNNYNSYTASFDIYKEKIIPKVTVEYKIFREKASTGNVIPDDEIEDEVDNEIIEDETTETDKDNEVNEDETGNVIPDTEEEITPPNTGAKINLAYESLLVLMLLSAIISLKKQCK